VGERFLTKVDMTLLCSSGLTIASADVKAHKISWAFGHVNDDPPRLLEAVGRSARRHLWSVRSESGIVELGKSDDQPV
jgi:hypothetical protein